MRRRHPGSRYRTNDYNLVDDGEMLRGSLTTGDGVLSYSKGGHVQGSLQRLLGKNVRAALEWRAGAKAELWQLRRVITGVVLHDGGYPEIPFGWRLRREHARDVYVLAPWWVFVRRDIARLAWRLHDTFFDFAWRHGALDENGWWPSCPRFE